MANSHWYTSLSPHCRTVFPCENVLPIGWLTHRVTMTFPLHTRTLSLLASFTRRVTVSSLCTYPLFAPEEASYTRGERSSFILYLLHLFAYYKPLHNTRKPSYRDSCRGNRWYHLKCIFFDFCVYYAGWFFYQKSVCIHFEIGIYAVGDGKHTINYVSMTCSNIYIKLLIQCLKCHRMFHKITFIDDLFQVRIFYH